MTGNIIAVWIGDNYAKAIGEMTRAGFDGAALRDVANGLYEGGPGMDAVTPCHLSFSAPPRIDLPPYTVASLVLY